MNKINRWFLSLLALSLVHVAQAQIPTAPPLTVPTFFQDATAWTTSFNTNTTLLMGSRFEIYNDVLYNNGQNLEDVLGARVNFHVATNHVVNLSTPFVETGMRYAGIGGAVDGGEFGLGYSATHYDLRFSLKNLVGYSKTATSIAGINHGSGYDEPMLGIDKVLVDAVVGFDIGYPINFKGKQSSYPEFRLRVTIPLPW